MSTQPLFRKVLQVGLVVRDSEATARRYWEEFGIGPWRFYTLDPGQHVEHAIPWPSCEALVSRCPGHAR